MSYSFLLCCCNSEKSFYFPASSRKALKSKPSSQILAESISGAGSGNIDSSTDFFRKETPSSRSLVLSNSGDEMYPSSSEIYVDHPDTNPKVQYSLVKTIGSGGFGTVFLCKDRRTRKKVVVKRIRGHARNEVMVTRKIAHESIIQYISSYTYGDTTLLVMEYIPGKKLSEIIKSEQRGYIPVLAEMLISYISKKCLSALGYLHKRNIIHLDIKADNIFLTVFGNVKLYDFGLCVELKKPWCTSPFVRGTPNWVSPEILQRHLYTSKSDIWSFGVTIVEMITGYPLNSTNFSYGNPVDSRNFITLRFNGEYNLSNEIIHFLSLCLMLDYKQRPSTTELLKDKFISSFNRFRSLQYVEYLIVRLVSKKPEPSVINNKGMYIQQNLQDCHLKASAKIRCSSI